MRPHVTSYPRDRKWGQAEVVIDSETSDQHQQHSYAMHIGLVYAMEDLLYQRSQL